MKFLFMQLVGPMQSWGTRSRFTERDTGAEPSFSGVLGMIAAAQGKDRSEPLGDLLQLHMAVRVDREGIMRRDFQTAEEVVQAGKRSTTTVISARYYLADAAFLAVLQGPEAVLEQAAAALTSPVWQLSLGRRSYVPSEPVLHHNPVGDAPDIETALLSRPLIVSVPPSSANDLQVRAVISDPKGSQIRNDVPHNDFASRSFLPRRVRTTFFSLCDLPVSEPASCT
jgi:CRISPR system Cascade subunit CasD